MFTNHMVKLNLNGSCFFDLLSNDRKLVVKEFQITNKLNLNLSRHCTHHTLIRFLVISLKFKNMSMLLFSNCLYTSSLITQVFGMIEAFNI